MKLTYSHKYTENTYSCGMTCTENLLNVGKRPQDSDRAGKSSQNQGGQKKKERKNEKGSRTGPATPGRSWKEEKFLHRGKCPHQQRNLPGQKRNFVQSWRRTQ